MAHVQLPQALKGQALKGSDLVLYSAFAALGFEVDILPVIEKYGRYGPDSPKRRTKDSVKYSDASYMESYAAESYYIAEYLKGMDDDPFIEYEEVLPQRPEWCADLDSRWKLLLLPSQVKGMKKVTQLGRKKGLPTKPNSAHDLATARAGTGLLPIRPPNLAKRWI